MDPNRLNAYFILTGFMLIHTFALAMTIYSNLTCNYVRIILKKNITGIFSGDLDGTNITVNNISTSFDVKIEVNQGLWQGQVDNHQVHDDCTRYVNNPFDSKWIAAKTFSVIAIIFALSTYILTFELLKLNYDKERKMLIRFTLIEVIFAQGFTFLAKNSKMCNHIVVPEDYDSASCVSGTGQFVSIVVMILWAFIAYISMSIPRPPFREYEGT